MKNTFQTRGFTLIELLVVIAIIATLAAFALPALQSALVRGQLAQALSNARQVYTAGFAMALDFDSTSDENLGWPGDLATRTGTAAITTVADYAKRLVEYDYLKPGDLKVFATTDIAPFTINGTTSDFNGSSHSGFKVYRTTSADSSTALFLATRNFAYGTEIAKGSTTKPFGDRGFIVFRKGGDGSVLKRQQSAVNSLKIVGTLPGTSNFSATENSNSTLTQNGSATISIN